MLTPREHRRVVFGQAALSHIMDMARVERMKGLFVTYWGAHAAQLREQRSVSVVETQQFIESWLRAEFNVDVTLDTAKVPGILCVPCAIEQESVV